MPKSTQPAAKGLKRPRTEKQLALADARYRDDKKLEKRYGHRFQAKALARFEKLIPQASKLKYGHLSTVAYTLAAFIDDQGNGRGLMEAIGRSRNKDLTAMRKLRLVESRKKVAHAA